MSFEDKSNFDKNIGNENGVRGKALTRKESYGLEIQKWKYKSS